MKKQIVALGGGGFMMEKTPAADLYIIEQSQKDKPKICLLPTASGDNIGLIRAFDYKFTQYGCDTEALFLLNPSTSDFEDVLLNQDIIYVTGGNSKSMLGLWKEWGIDLILKKAYDAGIILSGVSAGAVCWFKECLSDCLPDTFTNLPCLGILPYSSCVHYNENHRRETYLKRVQKGQIIPGFAMPNYTGLHFVDDKLFKAFSTNDWDLPCFVDQDTEVSLSTESI